MHVVGSLYRVVPVEFEIEIEQMRIIFINFNKSNPAMSQPRVNFNFGGVPGTTQPVGAHSHGQGQAPTANRYTAPAVNFQSSQYRHVEQTHIGGSTGQAHQYSHINQPARFTNTVTETKYIQPGHYDRGNQVISQGQAPRYVEHAHYEGQNQVISQPENVHYHEATHQVVSQPDTHQVVHSYAQGQVRQMARPEYRKVYNQSYDQRRAAISDVDPEKKKTCCGKWCWIIWGLLGLAALVLGLLFGLGVIGGWRKPDFNLRDRLPSGNADLERPNIRGDFEGADVDVEKPRLDADIDRPQFDADVNGPRVNINGTAPNIKGGLNRGKLAAGVAGGAALGATGAAIASRPNLVNGTAAVEEGEKEEQDEKETNESKPDQEQFPNTSFMYPPDWKEKNSKASEVPVVNKVVQAPIAEPQSNANTSFQLPPDQQKPSHRAGLMHTLTFA